MRRFHTDSRTRENFTTQGLTSLTGQSPRQWGRYVVKELIDNALEAAEPTDRPRVAVDLQTAGDSPYRHHVTRLTVRDNGPGLSRDAIERVADVEAFGSTKRHYALPTRGTQGNALMTILGIEHLAGEPLQLATRGRCYALHVVDDALHGRPRVEVEERGPAGHEETAITVHFGERGQQWARLDPIGEALEGFATLNPHVAFVVRDGEGVMLEQPGTADAPQQYAPRGGATSGRALWYAPQAFVERLAADIRAEPGLTLEAFVGEFDGIASRKKRRAVLETLGAPADVPLAEHFGANGQLDTGAAEALLAEMQQHTTPRSVSNLHETLGSVGEALARGPRKAARSIAPPDMMDRLRHETDLTGWEDLTLYYRGTGAHEHGSHRQPFVFELAAVPYRTGGMEDADHLFGINRSVAYSAPSVSLTVKDHSGRERSYRSIREVFSREKHSFQVVTCLTCPNIAFEDKGKQQFDTAPFAEVIADVVGKALRKYQRAIRPALNCLNPAEAPPPKLTHKAPRGFIKDTVFELFDRVYGEATEGGRYSITMRQLYYKMRPAFLEVADRHGYEYSSGATFENPKPIGLDYDTFSGYVSEYEKEILGERVVHRKERGFFIEPHSNQRVELSTKRIGQYEPAVAEQYGTLLFVEKTGFHEQIHKDFAITKRFDVGLINAEGFSTIALRQLVEKIQDANPSVRLLTLTDLDVKGFGIAEDAGRADALSHVDTFDAERLGVTVEDVARYDLPVEPATYKESTLTELDNRHGRGAISDAAYAFLRAGRRVELNAFAPTELKTYVETKLKAAGVEKITPTPEDVETPDVDDWEDVRTGAVREAIAQWVTSQVDEDLIGRLVAACRLELPTDRAQLNTDGNEVHAQVVERLRERPPQSWKDVNQTIIDELQRDVEGEQEAFKGEAIEAVLRYLEENDVIRLG